MSDEMEFFAERENLERIMADAKATYRDKLIGLRDYVAHELEGNRCKTCAMSQLRTGDTSSLVGKLKALLDDLEAIPDPNAEGHQDPLARLLARKYSRAPDAPASSEGNWN